MPQSADRLNETFSGKAFFQGLAFGALIFAGVACWLQYQAPNTLERLSKDLAFKTVAIGTADPDDESGIALQDMPPEPSPMRPAETEPLPEHMPESAALAPAPVESLIENSPEGRLPRKDSAGLTPFEAYRRPFDLAAAQGRPVVSLVITGLGLSSSATQAAFEMLPPAVSIALSAYAPAPDEIVADSRAKGHEVWMVLPLETKSYPRVDPGPHTLLTGVPRVENLEKLKLLMRQTTGYVGFLGTTDSTFIASVLDSKPILDEIFARGLAFADTSQAAPPHSGQEPYFQTDIWLDREVSQSDIRAKLEQLEALARKNGHASGIIQPLPLSYLEVKAWIDTLPGKGIVLAPLSAQALLPRGK